MLSSRPNCIANSGIGSWAWEGDQAALVVSALAAAADAAKQHHINAYPCPKVRCMH